MMRQQNVCVYMLYLNIPEKIVNASKNHERDTHTILIHQHIISKNKRTNTQAGSQSFG